MPQLSLDELEPGRTRAFSAEHALNEQIDDLERWVEASLRRQRRVVLRFWALRVPAMLAALLAIGAGAFGLATVFAGLAAGVALLLAADAVWSAAASRSPLRRALYDLRELQNTVKLRWDRVRLAHPDAESSKRVAYALALLDSIQVKRDDVNRYLVGLVPSPSVGKQPF
jgi:hypothetical protein